MAATPQFSVFTVTPSKVKMQTIQYRKSRILEMKEDKIQKASPRIRGLFLERPGNFSCSKSDLKIKTSLQCRRFREVHECFCLQKYHVETNLKRE